MWYISIQLCKTQTYFGKTKISSNFPPKLSVFVIFYEKWYVNPIFYFVYGYFEVFKIDFNICENQKNEWSICCLLEHIDIDLSTSRITLCGKSCDLERKYVVFATPVSQKRRRQPIFFLILDLLSTQMNVPSTKFSRKTMKHLNHNASTLSTKFSAQCWKTMGVIFINIDYRLNCLAGTGQLLVTLILVKLEVFSSEAW